MLPYKKLLSYINSHRIANKYQFSIKNNYAVIIVPKSNYHITIYQDQWDDYEKSTTNPYYLFHISTNDTHNRCSTYFWVDKINYKIQPVPKKYFSYNQPSFDYFSSTRTQCKLSDTKLAVKYFQSIINLCCEID